MSLILKGPCAPLMPGVGPLLLVIAMKADPELIALVENMREHFLVPPSAEECFGPLDAVLSPVSPHHLSALQGFRHSLSAALSTVAMPFALANSTAQQSHYQRIHSAERIRSLLINEDGVQEGQDLEAFREHAAYEKAQSRMVDFTESEEGRTALIRDTCKFLRQSLENGLESATQELLQQGLVLLWSAFEVLFRDTFETLLNQNPAAVSALIAHPKTRKRFEAEKLPLETLVSHGFDLSSRLGSVLVSQQDFSDLPTVKAAYSVLFPGSTDLTDALGNRELWTLFQCRHLVVHRRGVVDRTYLDATGENLPVGERLSVKPRDFENAMTVVVSAGTALAGALASQNAAQQRHAADRE